MIDWSKERASKNYCGWCIDITCVCDGRCFTTGTKEELCKNRVDHLKTEIEKTKIRLNDLEHELINVTYR